MDIGFIGAGSMGSAMIPNLVKAGHHVSVWNRNTEAAKRFEEVTVLNSPAEAFAKQALITMLSDDRAVQSVILDSGVLRSANKECVHVVMATISPALVESLQEAHRRAGIAYVSAPVFGIPAVAQKGELNIMASGDSRAIEKVQPLFDALGQKTWPLGDDPKHANIAKIAGNLMITLAIEAMGEATALTEAYGLKVGDFLNIVTSTMFASPSYKRYGDNIAKNTYEPGFKLTLGLKDLNLALDAAKSKDADLGAAQVVRDNLQQAVDQGLGVKDWSALAQATQRRAGVTNAGGGIMANDAQMHKKSEAGEKEPFWKGAPLRTSRRGHFWIAGERVAKDGKTFQRGPMFVDWETPEKVTKPLPIVLVHGGTFQCTEWLETPDGRPGWAERFQEAGYAVFLVDRPGHGRSPYHPDIIGPTGPPFSYERAREVYFAAEVSQKQTQWPFDPADAEAYDQFLAGYGPMPADLAASEDMDADRLARLLDKIGPAIVVTHSASGPDGWLVADRRPGLVAGIVSIEPMGPPFADMPGIGALAWGLTAPPVTYDPPRATPEEVKAAAPATLRMPALSGVPIAIVKGEPPTLRRSGQRSLNSKQRRREGRVA